MKNSISTKSAITFFEEKYFSLTKSPVIARYFHDFPSIQTDSFPLLSFSITPLSLSRLRRYPILLTFCLSSNWSGSTSHNNLTISCFVKQPWSFRESNSKTSHFFSTSPLCLEIRYNDSVFLSRNQYIRFQKNHWIAATVPKSSTPL